MGEKYYSAIRTKCKVAYGKGDDEKVTLEFGTGILEKLKWGFTAKSIEKVGHLYCLHLVKDFSVFMIIIWADCLLFY